MATAAFPMSKYMAQAMTQASGRYAHSHLLETLLQISVRWDLLNDIEEEVTKKVQEMRKHLGVLWGDGDDGFNHLDYGLFAEKRINYSIRKAKYIQFG